MKKGNKRLLVLAALLLLIAVGTSTYAIYKSSAEGTASASTANWVVKVNNADTVATNTFTLDQVNWGTNANVASGKIAPGSTGTVTITLDATGTEVALNYTATVGTIKEGNVALSTDRITASLDGNAEGTIGLSDAKTKTITLTITWLGAADDDAEEVAADLALRAKNITIPVTVTATQKLS